jgi:hypothetical protein
VQHPKPLPTPNEHGVLKFASDIKTQTAVEAEECSKTSKGELAVQNSEEEKK